jgi:hypothetical protein
MKVFELGAFADAPRCNMERHLLFHAGTGEGLIRDVGDECHLPSQWRHWTENECFHGLLS